MEKSIQNQKVFISLSAVMEVQKRYLDTSTECRRLRERDAKDPLLNSYVERKRTMEQLIDLLSLPIAHQ